MISIVDYDVCNLASIQNMLKQIKINTKITKNSNDIINSKFIILPGVGNFVEGIKNLEKKGLDIAIRKAHKKKINILGICLGMQLLFEKSEEGNHDGLGLIKGTIKKFDSSFQNIQIPHMGWNYVEIQKKSKLYFDYKNKTKFYFAHSYYVDCEDKNSVVGLTTYGKKFCCAIESSNLFGVQFHPEKSHNFGKAFFKNFFINVT